MLACGESISVARGFAQKHGYDIDPERELMVIGMANLAIGLFRGLPVGRGMCQSAINDMSGAKSPLPIVTLRRGRADAPVLRRGHGDQNFCAMYFRAAMGA